MTVDLIADVMRAARAELPAAQKRLQAEAAAPAGGKTIFDRILQESPAAPLKPGLDIADRAMQAAGSERLAAAHRALEANLMANALDAMMPKDAYGSGTAGNVWRGMFVEQAAEAIAANGLLDLNPPDPRVTPVAHVIGGEDAGASRKIGKITPFAG